MNILEEANALTSGERNKAYGNPLDNFNQIAKLWCAYISAKHGECPPLDFEDVAMLNVLQKIARQCHKSKRDNLVDMAGYIRTIEMAEEHQALEHGRAAFESKDIDNSTQEVIECPIHKDGKKPGAVMYVPGEYCKWNPEQQKAWEEKNCKCRR